MQERIRNGSNADKVWINQPALFDSLMKTNLAPAWDKRDRHPGSETHFCPAIMRKKKTHIHSKQEDRKEGSISLMRASFLTAAFKKDKNHPSVNRKMKG